MARNTLLATVEEYGVRNGMALPAAKAVPHRRPIAVDRRSNRHEAYPAAAITLLQHRTQVGRQDIRLDERISEIGNTHRTGLYRQLIQRAIERCHAAQGGIAVILNAGHAAATGIHKGGLHFRGRRQQTVRFAHDFRHGTHIAKYVYPPQHMAPYRAPRQQVQQQKYRQHNKHQPTCMF